VDITPADFALNLTEKKVSINQKKINELMEGSVTQSLIGAVPHPDITLEEIRSLRLQKHDDSH